MPKDHIKELIELLEAINTKDLEKFTATAIKKISHAFDKKRKILIAGNGGSAADASHFSTEFAGRYRFNRKGLPSICLTADSTLITCWSNDFHYDDIFARQVQALGHRGDILFLMTTSGKSKNLLEAAKQAKKQGIYVISLLGKGGGDLKKLSDLMYIVPSNTTARIQEIQKLIIHVISEEVENKYV